VLFADNDFPIFCIIGIVILALFISYQFGLYCKSCLAGVNFVIWFGDVLEVKASTVFLLGPRLKCNHVYVKNTFVATNLPLVYLETSLICVSFLPIEPHNAPTLYIMTSRCLLLVCVADLSSTD